MTREIFGRRICPLDLEETSFEIQLAHSVCDGGLSLCGAGASPSALCCYKSRRFETSAG